MKVSLRVLLNFSQSQRTGAVNLSSGAAGVNLLNLRGLGSQRVLVLLDGKRVINAGLTASYTGADTNTMPQNLVSRVDVVTGGASAQYWGSFGRCRSCHVNAVSSDSPVGRQWPQYTVSFSALGAETRRVRPSRSVTPRATTSPLAFSMR